MNTKVILTLLAFFAWAWFTWSWLNDKRQECCPTTIIVQGAATTSNKAYNQNTIQPVTRNIHNIKS